MKIQLTQGKTCLIDNDDYELIKEYSWAAHFERSNWYAVTSKRINGKLKTIRMHRLILDAKPGQYVDHINRNGLDNRKSNIRICTPQQNTLNRISHKNSSSKYKGVSLRKTTNKYESYISINGKRKHLGFFKKEIDAAKAYNSAALKYYNNDFILLNQV